MPRVNGRLLAVLCVAALAAQAQAPQFKGGVDVVRFDVVVLDKARHPIPGLAERDFHVTEDGKPLRIAAFEARTIPTTAAPPTVTAGRGTADLRVDSVTNHRDVPGRLVVIVMDRSIPAGDGIVTARKIANTAIDALGPNDLAAVVFTSGVAGYRLQGLTANRDRLRASVASAQMGTPTGVEMMRNGDLRRGGPDYPEKTCGEPTLLTLAGVADAIAAVPDYRKMILFIGTEVPSPDGSVTGDPLECGLTISLHEQ